jgi:hypothetical protein
VTIKTKSTTEAPYPAILRRARKNRSLAQGEQRAAPARTPLSGMAGFHPADLFTVEKIVSLAVRSLPTEWRITGDS